MLFFAQTHPSLPPSMLCPSARLQYRIAVTKDYFNLFFYSFLRLFFSFKSRKARLHRESRPRVTNVVLPDEPRTSNFCRFIFLFNFAPKFNRIFCCFDFISLSSASPVDIPRRSRLLRETQNKSVDPRCKAYLAQAVSHTTSIKDFQSVKHIL